MKMKGCKCCGWWFEPKTPRQSYCDEECSYEGRKTSWSRYGKKRYARKKSEKAAEKKMSAIKCNPGALRKPYIKYVKPSEMRFLPPNKEIVNCVQ